MNTKSIFPTVAKWVACVPLVVLILLVGCGKSKPADTKSERKVLYYQSAMHPWIKSDKPGRCTICGMELTPVYEGETGLDVGGDMISLSASSIRVLNVQTMEVKTQALTKTLTVAGTIDDDDAKHRVLSAYIPGRIEKLHVSYVGAEVKAGEPLAEFYSPMLLQTEREYRAIASSTNSDLRSAVASRLRQVGLTPEQIEALPAKPADAITSQILAPISGTVVEKKIYAGQYVQEGEKLFEIADFATMWFQFRAYEQDLPWIHAGQKVDVTTPSLPGKVVAGVIKFIDPNLDEATRSTKVRVELENPIVDGRRLFSHRLYADGVVHLDAPEAVVIPRSAIIQTGPEAIAFVDQGGGGYARRVLQLGRRGDALVEIISGVSAGEKVVVNGNLLIDGQAEMNRSYASHPMHSDDTNAAPTFPALTGEQRKAVKDFLALADALGTSLSVDDVKEFNAQAGKTHVATPTLLNAFDRTNAWQALLKPVEKVGHLSAAENLKAARKAFHPFSEATVALAQALRRTDKEFASVKVFRCPMTKDAFPGAPNRADWIQLKPEVRNPWFGAEMIDCGSEVKP
ncbi:MAG: efflux RND transporter periplasmic adaptor subunit [Verrucomicrobia bacterium]|nr:efflux RND transporter periplasmic adaptor subunit [Verrucomicrobiota bacterium]